MVFACGLLCHCGSLERSNPADPAIEYAAGGEQTLSLAVPLPKALVSVVDSMVARLTGPNITPITKSLIHSPLGPATVTIGALEAGGDRVVVVEGYDHDGNLIMMGEKRNITISVGDTTRVVLNLELLGLPVGPAEGDPGQEEGGDPPSDDAPSADDGTSAAGANDDAAAPADAAANDTAATGEGGTSDGSDSGSTSDEAAADETAAETG